MDFIHCHSQLFIFKSYICPVSFQSFLLRCGAHPQISQDLSFISFFNQVYNTKLINSLNHCLIKIQNNKKPLLYLTWSVSMAMARKAKQLNFRNK